MLKCQESIITMESFSYMEVVYKNKAPFLEIITYDFAEINLTGNN